MARGFLESFGTYARENKVSTNKRDAEGAARGLRKGPSAKARRTGAVVCKRGGKKERERERERERA